jgi:uncharacterized membrane protein YphA (DoxX/SURF4 family)
LIRATIPSIILAIIRVALGGLFVFAGSMKLFGPGATPNQSMIDFSASVNAFKILPPQLIEPAAWTIPWIEIIAGAMIIAGLWTRSASLALGALVGAFIYAIRMALDSGNVDIDCGCFGGRDIFCSSEHGLTECHFWRNTIMAAITGILLITGAGRFSLDALFFRSRKDGDDNGDFDAVSDGPRPVTREIEGRPAGL